MAYLFTVISSTNFRLDGDLFGPANNTLDLSDNLINMDEAFFNAGFDDEPDFQPLQEDADLLAGGIGAQRRVTVVDLLGSNTLLAGNDVLSRLTVTMGDGDDFIEGGRNGDVINAGNGNNEVFGFDGNDRITTGSGDDMIDGGAGNDTINAGNGNNFVDGGDGDDRITTGNGIDIVFGGAGNDTINSGDGADEVYGDDGNDVIDAGNGNNYVEGGAGNDRITTGNGDDIVFGDDGDDVINTGDATFIGDFVDGGNGNDTITTGNGRDYVEGGAGNDRISTGSGNDTVFGGDGNDTINAGDGDDDVSGGAGNDTIDGGSGDDRLDGGAGNDTITGGFGNDLMMDGTGRDRLFMNFGDDTVMNTNDGERDVFVWNNLAALIEAGPEYDIIEFFDVRGARNNDVLDFFGLGNGLFAQLYGGGGGETGVFAVFLTADARTAGDFLIAVQWNEQIGNEPINVGVSSNSDIRIGFGWNVENIVSGDTFI